MKFEDDILIIDDESSDLQWLADLLEREGYKVRPAEAAQVAIDSALARPPMLILLDTKMPGMKNRLSCEMNSAKATYVSCPGPPPSPLKQQAFLRA